MKLLGIIIALWCLALSARADMVIGEVLSVNDDGILVLCDSGGRFGEAKPNDGTIVFVYGSWSLADGDKVNITGLKPDGIYKYESAGNALKTVRAYRK